MVQRVEHTLSKAVLDLSDLEHLLGSQGDDREQVLAKAAEVARAHVGDAVRLRGLIEYSNRCRKNCCYCGIRSGNGKVVRYEIDPEGVLKIAREAWDRGYGSVVLQSGERIDKAFIMTIDRLVREMMSFSGGKIRITLSCGEQDRETYLRWFESGALRYLLRFESSDPDLYHRIHPQDGTHSYAHRIMAIRNLKQIGYLTGSGMMIGLPGQTLSHLAGDLMLLKQLQVDMVGMGPYIEHPDTPLYSLRDHLQSAQQRFRMSVLAIAVLRLHMPHINIAASTALDALDPAGREKALAAGANVLMPNLTPACYRENYFLYKDKPWLIEADELVSKVAAGRRLHWK